MDQPAAITSILVSREAFGYLPTTVSLVVNMSLVFLTLAFAPSSVATCPRR